MFDSVKISPFTSVRSGFLDVTLFDVSSRMFIDWKMNLSPRERGCNSLKQSRIVLLILLGKKYFAIGAYIRTRRTKRIPCRKVSVIHRSLLRSFEKHSMHRASSFLEIRFPSIRLKRGMVTRQGHRFVLNVAETADSNVLLLFVFEPIGSLFLFFVLRLCVSLHRHGQG